MKYQGQVLGIPVGMDGLKTDDPDCKLSAGSMIRALNVTLHNGLVEKMGGSRRWNSTALPSGVMGAMDWWPDEATQRMIALAANGRVYRFIDSHTSAEVAVTGSAPATLNSSQYANFVAAGAEESGNPRKLFIFTGYDPVQVISGDGTSRATISGPVGDWSGTNHPVDGVIHQGRLFVFLRRGSTMFASLATDHEDFSTLPLPYEAYPGESEYIAQAFVFRGKLFVIKYPTGLYVLDDTDPSASNWFFRKVNSFLGARSPRGFLSANDDVFIANDYGSISSLTATDQTGDVLSSDIFAQLRCQKFVRDTINPDSGGAQHAIYYKDKKIGIFSFRGRTSSRMDRLCFLDFQNIGNLKVVWSDKDQPNCLFTVKDIRKMERPFYGANDGYLYALDQPDLWVGSADKMVQTAYSGEFWLPHFDFAAGDVGRGKSNKNFDFLEITYKPMGHWDLTIEYFIDGKYINTLTADMGGDSDLDRSQIDSLTTDAEAEKTLILPMPGSGRRLSLRCYNANVGQGFGIVEMQAWFRLSGDQSEKGKR